MAFVPIHHEVAPPEASKRHYTPALIVLAVLYFMMGFITCLNDTLVPFFKIGFTLSYTESALVQFYFFLTYAVMSIPAGRIVEKVGYKSGMVLGFAIAGLGAFLFYPASIGHQYHLFLTALFVLAIGIVLLQVAANPYITLLGSRDTASARLTLVQGVGSVGTTVAPLFGAHFILSGLSAPPASSDAVSAPYIAIGSVLLLFASVVFFLALPKITHQTETGGGKSLTLTPMASVFAFRNLNFGLLGIFMYVGAEVAIGTFLTNYIADTLNLAEHQANSYVSLYWGGMLVGRLAGAGLLKFVKPQRVLACAALLAIALIMVSILTSGNVAVWTMVATGLCNSVMFAIVFSLSISGLGAYTTKASGLLSSAIVGGAVVPFFVGMLIDRFSWGVAFLLPLACYAYLLFYAYHGFRSRNC